MRIVYNCTTIFTRGSFSKHFERLLISITLKAPVLIFMHFVKNICQSENVKQLYIDVLLLNVYLRIENINEECVKSRI